MTRMTLFPAALGTLLMLSWITLVSAAEPAGAKPPTALDAATRARVLDGLYQEVADHYVEADTAKLIVESVRRRQKAGAYDGLADPVRFAEAVTRDLRSVNHDLHLSLRFNPTGAPPAGGGMRRIVRTGPGGPGAPAGPGAAPGEPMRRVVIGGPGGAPKGGQPTQDDEGGDEAFIREARSKNFGLTKVEVLPGNVGYLNVTGFMGAPGSDEAIGHALRLLERTDAILIDVRQNPGGSGQMSHYLFSHFLPATPVNTIKVKSRESAEPVVMQSFAEVAGPRRTDVPLYVLTSRGTGSAAEEFSFVLKNQGRATLVGEPTAGAGHMVNFFPLTDGFSTGVSITRVSDPRTGLEWEANGVQPDVRVAAGRALTTAHTAALRGLAAKATDDRQRRRLEWAAEWVEAEADAKAAGFDATRAATMVGRYEGDRSVTLAEGRLLYARGSRPPLPLIPLRDGRFALSAETRLGFGAGTPAASLEEERLDGTRSTYVRAAGEAKASAAN